MNFIKNFLKLLVIISHSRVLIYIWKNLKLLFKIFFIALIIFKINLRSSQIFQRFIQYYFS
jgi:hypothetical protein